MDVTLHHYNIKHPVDIHVYASLYGLRAVLFEDGKLAAQRHLQLQSNSTQILYMNCWQLVFVIKCFHTYVFGHNFTFYTEHKPLEQLQWKTLADAPVYLQ